MTTIKRAPQIKVRQEQKQIIKKTEGESFLRDAEQKSLKILADTWITRKTIDDGVEVPMNFDTNALNAFTKKVADGIGVKI